MDFAAFAAARRMLQTNDGDIAYVDIGRGPPIVFVHGLPLNGAHWRGVIGTLGSDFRCIAPDLLGFGHTERAAGRRLDFTAQAEMIVTFLDRLGVSSFHLVGNDSGGAIAQIVACRAPARLLSLTLTNCDVDANVPPPSFAPVAALAKSGQLGGMMAQMRSNLALAQSDAGLGVGFENRKHVTAELVEAYIAPLVATPERERQFNEYVAILDASHTIAIRERLAALAVPTQILWGTADVFFTLDEARWLARTIPGCRRLVEAKGGRLFFCEERPAWAAARISEFASGL